MAKAAVKKHDQEIRVHFFGTFRIVVGDVVINDASSRARRPWNLLQYLMVYRNKTVSRQQLVDALWPDGSSEQPDKALKNLVYRVRSMFAAKGIPYAQEVILYKGGHYQLNNDLPWVIDFELSEHYFSKAQEPDLDLGERVEYTMQAIDLYQGDFLSEQMYEDWVLPYSTHYRSQFFKCVYYTLDALETIGRHEDIEFVCNRGIAIDPFEEGLHLSYMNALVQQGKKSAALTHYNKMADMFFREMGVMPREELREMYQDLSHQLNKMETDLHSIKDALSEPDVSNDAFYCDFDVFRNLYRLEARAAERTGQAVFVGLLTLMGEDGPLEEGEALSKSMGHLLDVLHKSLRRGDVVSRFSLCQYILMLPTITVENAEMVLHRVIDRFEKANTEPEVQLFGKIQPLDPVIG